MKLFKKKDKSEHKNEIPMKNLIENAGGCIISKSILDKKSKLKWIFRQEPVNSVDNGWVAFGEGDTEEYINDSNNMAVCDFNILANIEPAVLMIYHMPVGSDLELITDKSETYFIDSTTGKEIRETVKPPIDEAFKKNLKFISKNHYEVQDIKKLFQQSDKIKCEIIGKVDVPTGKIVVADPLCYLMDLEYAEALNYAIPKGTYPVEVAVCYSNIVGLRIAAARLKISDGDIFRYEIAMSEGKNLEEIEEVLTGFGVDAGLGCFCDIQVAKEYKEFLSEWYKGHSGGNHYDDYFADLFSDSYKKRPDIQGEVGDFIEWANPNTGNCFTMFTSGLGDGFYNALWGLDSDDNICELVIPFMDVDLF